MGVFVTLVALSMRNVNQVREKAKEAEGKQNLHTIQLAVERFGVDHGGAYPAYLIGGEARFTDSPFPMPGEEVHDCADLQQISDPLLREGYLPAYPANPFIKPMDRSAIGVHTAQIMPMIIAPESRGIPDPLGNGTPEGQVNGTRFGANYDVMGQVLAEPRYAQWADAARPGQAHASYADIGYEMWDIQGEPEAFTYLVGQFFYKSSGELTIMDAMANGYGATKPLAPRTVTAYMLGVYGGARAKGKDVIGPEQALSSFGLPSGKPAPPVWPWTRSIVEIGDAGSPYSAAPGLPELQYGNPNAIRDGVVLALTTP